MVNLIIMILCATSNSSIESLLGKEIFELQHSFTLLDDTEFEKTYILKNVNHSFLSKSVDLISVKTDSKNIIQSVSTGFNRVVDLKFFGEIVTNYGDPISMYKPSDKFIVETGVLENGMEFNLSEGKLEECSFEDKPLFINWKSKDLKIVLILDHINGTTSLNIPVIVGVDAENGSPNPDTDNTTDHFVVVVRMGTDSKGNYFQVYYNASGIKPLRYGANPENKLYYDNTTGLITCRTYTAYSQDRGKYPYIVTMVRKSKLIN